jgi:NTP pyrophosphatase (non-canonical NTP hydrolase)
MNPNEYQVRAHALAIYPRERDVEYVALGLASEAGEVAGKVKKQIRDGANWNGERREEHRRAILAETGDVLWYCAELLGLYGLTLEEAMVANIEKLESRKVRGVISGSGDNR